MTVATPHADLPVHSPLNREPMASPLARRVLGRREVRRLAELMDDAEKRARARIELATREAEEIFAHARAEAEEILRRLPDFSQLERTKARKGKTAFQVVREVADRHGLAFAVVVGRQAHPRATAARSEAIRAVVKLMPGITDTELGALFSGRSADNIRKLRTKTEGA
ncbi:MAG: hypothetical protein LCH86_20920 [Proteobacteria bacterium]|nr:hypothetical protein [Pseudomonadota bacterium]